jgi:hypothetical protein
MLNKSVVIIQPPNHVVPVAALKGEFGEFGLFVVVPFSLFTNEDGSLKVLSHTNFTSLPSLFNASIVAPHIAGLFFDTYS